MQVYNRIMEKIHWNANILTPPPSPKKNLNCNFASSFYISGNWYILEDFVLQVPVVSSLLPGGIVHEKQTISRSCWHNCGISSIPNCCGSYICMFIHHHKFVQSCDKSKPFDVGIDVHKQHESMINVIFASGIRLIWVSFLGMLWSRPAISMLEDAEKKGLITPGKVSSHCYPTHYRTVLVKIICSVLKVTRRPKASWVRLDA